MKVALPVLPLVVFAVSLLPSCGKSLAQQAVDEKILGSWEWVRTDGGIANHIHETPASTGQEKTLLLNANNTYVIMVNSAVFSQGTFIVESKQCIHDGRANDGSNAHQAGKCALQFTLLIGWYMSR